LEEIEELGGGMGGEWVGGGCTRGWGERGRAGREGGTGGGTDGEECGGKQ